VIPPPSPALCYILVDIGKGTVVCLRHGRHFKDREEARVHVIKMQWRWYYLHHPVRFIAEVVNGLAYRLFRGRST